MTEHWKGFEKAQREYENKEPPDTRELCEECGEELVKGVCPECPELSECCGAEIYDDTDICSACKEHCK